jgi:hypothetical protein
MRLKKKFMKIVKDYLSDFYTKKKVKELVPLQEEKKTQKKFRLNFDGDDDDENDTGESELAVLDLKKEITAYCKLQVNQQNLVSKSSKFFYFIL